MIFKRVCHFRQAHRASGWSGCRSGGESESQCIAGLRLRCWLAWSARAGVNAAGYGGAAPGRRFEMVRRALQRKRCVAADCRHGRQRLFVCEKSERVERPRVLWIARYIFNLLPRVGVWLRIGAGDRKNQRRSGENVVRFCAFIRERAFGIIECQNRIALSSSDLTSPHDVDWRRPAALCQQRFHLLRSQRYFTGDEPSVIKSRRSSTVRRCASSTFFHHSSAAAH